MPETATDGEGQRHGARPSQRRSSLRRRGTIIEATRQLLSESEAEKVLVADVAQRAGVSVATVYNLVGPRDQLLVSVLDHAVEEIEARLEVLPRGDGVEACLATVGIACEVVLADATAHRRVLSSLGTLSSELWLATGLTQLIRDAVAGAVEASVLNPALATESLATAIQLGFRGVLVSWAYGRLSDATLGSHAELQASYLLAYAASDGSRAAIQRRIQALEATVATTAPVTTTTEPAIQGGP